MSKRPNERWWDVRSKVKAGIATLKPGGSLDNLVTESEDSPAQSGQYVTEQPQHPTVMAFRQAGGGAGAGSPTLPAPQHVPHIPKPGFRFPKEGYYAAAAIGAAIVIYVAGWAAGVFPPSRTVNNINVNPPPVSTPVPLYTPTPTQTPKLTPTATPIPGIENILSEEQIRDYAIPMPTQPITPEGISKAVAVNNSIYHLFTGKTFEQVNFINKLLTHEEYKSLEGKEYGTSPDSAGSIAVGPSGETFIYVDIEAVGVNSSIDVLFTLFHETGNAEANRRVLNGPKNYELGIKSWDEFLKETVAEYKLGNVSDLNIPWIKGESLQALYRSVGFHKLEELGVVLGTPYLQKNIEDTVDAIVKSNHFLPQASVVAWSMALNRADTAESLRTTGRITSQQAYSLFDEATVKGRSQTREWFEQRVVEVVNAVRNAEQYAQPMKDASILSQRTSIGNSSSIHSP